MNAVLILAMVVFSFFGQIPFSWALQTPGPSPLLTCDVDARWDNGNRPIEDGSLGANMVLEELNGTEKKIEITKMEGEAALRIGFDGVQGFAANTRFVDDQYRAGNNFKFRGFLLKNMIVGPQMIFVKGYLLNCK